MRAWRNVHLLSYFLFATATVHMVMAGTDLKSIFTTTALVLIGAMTVFGTAALYLWRSEPRDQAARRAARTRVATATRSAMPTPTVTSHAAADLLQASGAEAKPVTSQPATRPAANGHSTPT